MLDFRTIVLSQTNSYLLKLKYGFLLIDCGNVRDKDSFLKILGSLGTTLKDIRYLFLTHHHNDHCGLMKYLTSENPSVQVIMSRKCAEYMETGIHFKHNSEKYSNSALRMIVGTYSKFCKNWSDKFTPYYRREHDIIIERDDDNTLPQLGIDGKIILTPGHTEDSISLIAGYNAFVGDAARNMLNFTGMPYYPILYYDAEKCRECWRKLAESGVKTIFPAHGRPFNIGKLMPLINKEIINKQKPGRQWNVLL